MKNKVTARILFICIIVMTGVCGCTNLPDASGTVKVQSKKLRNSHIIKSGWNWNPTPKSWKTIDLNNTWKFKHMGNSSWKAKDDFSDTGIKGEFYLPSFDDAKWKDIPVPWTWNMEYGQDDKRLNLYGICWYRKTFDLKGFNNDKEKVLLEFKGIGGTPYLWINGEKIKMFDEVAFSEFDKTQKNPAYCGMLRQYVDISKYVNNGQNVIAMRIYDPRKWNSRAKSAGLVNGVFVRITPKTYFDYVLVTPGNNKVKVDLYSGSDTTAKFSGTARVLDVENSKVIGEAKVDGELKKDAPLGFDLPVSGHKMWSPDNPNLYFLTISDDSGNEVARERFGFRTMAMKDGDLYFNGKRFRARGGFFSRYFNSAFRYNKVDEEPRKTSSCNEKNYYTNAVRIVKDSNWNLARGQHVQPYTDTYFNIADKLGFMYYFEMPDHYYMNKELLKRLMFQLYNHPSVAIWEFGNEQFECWHPGITEYMNRGYKWAKSFDRQKRPISPTSGMSITLKAADADIMDLHHYFGENEYSVKGNKNYNDNIYKVTKESYKEQPAFFLFESSPMTHAIHHVKRYWEKAKLSEILATKDLKEKRAKLAEALTRKKKSYYTFRMLKAEQHFGYMAPSKLDDKLQLYWERVCEFLRMYRKLDYIDGVSFGNCNGKWLTEFDKEWKLQPNNVAEIVKNCFAPIMVSLSPYRRNFFSGEKATLKATIVNDSTKNGIFQIKCIAKISGSEKEIFSSKSIKVDSFKQKDIDIAVKMPEVSRVEHGILILALFKDDREINRQEYRLFVSSMPPEITMAKETRVAVYNAASELFKGLEDDDASFSSALKELKIKAVSISNFKELDKYNLLVIDERSYDRQVLGNSEKIKAWLENGGKLLCLQQECERPVPWLGNASLEAVTPAIWTSVTDADHPIFKDLDTQDLRGPFNGNNEIVVRKAFNPVQESFIAVNYSNRGWRASIVDEKVGKGEAIHMQLGDLGERFKKDPVAARLIYNTMNYLLNGNRELAVASTVKKTKERKFYNFAIDYMHFVNLRSYCNMAFKDETSGDKKGGWLDFGSADLREIPTGRQNWRGVFFDIINPANNNGKSIIALAGVPRKDTDRSYFPKEVKGIKVGAKLKQLFFLHAAMWVTKELKGKEVMRYVIHYKSGKTAEFPVFDRIDIADWHHPVDNKNALAAFIDSKDDGLFIAKWENPNPNDKIESIDIISNGKAIPGVVAITGERAE
jgi:glycosyl hydrolase family 2